MTYIPPTPPAIVHGIVLEANIGDVVSHPHYGAGLIVGVDVTAGFPDGETMTRVMTVLWSDGHLDGGWPEVRIATYVVKDLDLRHI